MSNNPQNNNTGAFSKAMAYVVFVMLMEKKESFRIRKMTRMLGISSREAKALTMGQIGAISEDRIISLTAKAIFIGIIGS